MAETLKSFIDKLQSDGVVAGEQKARKIQAEAEEKARQIISQAQEQAKKIVEDAQRERESIQSKTRTELELAARDTVNRLQETLTKGLQGVMTVAVQEKLGDVDFVGKMLLEIVNQYVGADAQGSAIITINVSEELKHKLAEWAIATFHKSPEFQEKRKFVDLQGTLKKAGFEYRMAGGTVEVTTESTVETLMDLVGPEVRELLSKTSKNNK
jgi:V/A-type H+-transporting ATPase subunit E